jgi:hypothetical protein
MLGLTQVKVGEAHQQQVPSTCKRLADEKPSTHCLSPKRKTKRERKKYLDEIHRHFGNAEIRHVQSFF